MKSLADFRIEVDTLQQNISLWSRANFGDRCGPDNFAPYAGIIEECGELMDAVEPEDVRDAIGDIGVYSMDFLARRNIAASKVFPPNTHSVAFLVPKLMWVYAGQLSHAVLKTHQRIRGFEDPVFSEAKITTALSELLMQVNLRGVLFDCTKSTFENIVRKRDWKADPTHAAD